MSDREPGSEHAVRPGKARREIARILWWCGISNILLAAMFITALNADMFKRMLQPPPPQQSTAARLVDPAAVSRLSRSDNEAWTRGVQSQFKVPLALTRQIRQSAPADDPPVSDVSGERIAPLLTASSERGQVRIGNFSSMSFQGDPSECLETATTMLDDIGGADSLLDVMVNSDSIFVAKICAVNGLVVISCRADQTVISPRRSRPDDGCQRNLVSASY